MKHRIVAGCIAAACGVAQPAYAGLFDGIADGLGKLFDVSGRRLEVYKSVFDKQMVDAFYVLSEG